MSSKAKMRLQALAMAETQQKNIKDDIKSRIQVLPELRDLIPALQGEELQQLEANLKAEGCREPLIVWVQPGKDPVLVDGHNRYGICQQHGIDFKIVEKEFPSLEAVKDFMIDNQLGRRNLSTQMASYLRGLKYERYKAKERNTDHLKQNQKNSDSGDSTVDATLSPTEKTSEKLAKEFNVSERTIYRDADYAKGIELIGKSNPELKQQIINGQAKPQKSDIQLIGKKAPNTANVKSVEEIRQLAEQLKAPVKKPSKSKAQTNGQDKSNSFAGRKLTVADVVRYTLMATKKYPEEFQESNDPKQDLQQLQKLAVQALNESNQKQEAEWLEKQLASELKKL